MTLSRPLKKASPGFPYTVMLQACALEQAGAHIHTPRKHAPPAFPPELYVTEFWMPSHEEVPSLNEKGDPVISRSAYADLLIV